MARSIPVSTTDMDSSFFLSYNSAPVDVTVYTNATYLSTGNGRAVGVFEHDLTVATDLNNMNPWGNMYTVNNPEWNTPSSLVGTHTNIAQSWLNRGDPFENTIMNKWAIAIGNTQKTQTEHNPQGSVSQPVYGESLGTQVYHGNRFREVGCSQADCPLGRLFLNSMIGAAWKIHLCPEPGDAKKEEDGKTKKEGGGPPNKKESVWCIAVVNGNAFATSLSSYGQSWRDGKDRSVVVRCSPLQFCCVIDIGHSSVCVFFGFAVVVVVVVVVVDTFFPFSSSFTLCRHILFRTGTIKWACGHRTKTRKNN